MPPESHMTARSPPAPLEKPTDWPRLFSANATLIANYGWQALMDGAAMQLVELLVTGYLSMAAYVLFKVCEHRLAHGLADPPVALTPEVAAPKAEAKSPDG